MQEYEPLAQIIYGAVGELQENNLNYDVLVSTQNENIDHTVHIS